MRRMYGLFTYMISVKNGDPFKGKWLGKYSRPMEHLGLFEPSMFVSKSPSPPVINSLQTIYG